MNIKTIRAFGDDADIRPPSSPFAAVNGTLAVLLAKPVRKPESDPHASRVLVIEDDEKIAGSLAIRLHAAGYEHILAFDTWAGVISAIHRDPDLIILDISLPQGSGFDVAERLQKFLPVAIPMIFITASTQPGLRERAKDLGAADFFEKPYEAMELLAAIQKALSNKRLPAPRRPWPNEAKSWSRIG